MAISEIKNELKSLLTAFLFEKNDKLTRTNITTKLNGYLEDLSSHACPSHLRIFDYRVICDETNNEEACIIKNEVKITVKIQETEEKEFFNIPITIKENECL